MILEYWFAATNTGIWLTSCSSCLVLLSNEWMNERTNGRKDQLAQHMQSITSLGIPWLYLLHHQYHPAKLPYSISILQRCNNTGRCKRMCQNALAPVNQHSNRERFDPTAEAAVCHLNYLLPLISASSGWLALWSGWGQYQWVSIDWHMGWIFYSARVCVFNCIFVSVIGHLLITRLNRLPFDSQSRRATQRIIHSERELRAEILKVNEA